MTIRADISGSDGTRFIREALVSLEGGNGRPYVIREWRRGDIDSASARQESPQGGRAPVCAFATRRQAELSHRRKSCS